jgi:hypothetical protein
MHHKSEVLGPTQQGSWKWIIVKQTITKRDPTVSPISDWTTYIHLTQITENYQWNNILTMKNLTWGPFYNMVSYVLCCLLFIIILSKWQFTISMAILYLQDLPFVCWGDRSSIHLTSEEPVFGSQDLSQWVAFHPWVSHHCSGDSDYV